MSYIKEQWAIGRKIYGKRSWRETRRTLLHTVRSVRDKSYYEDLHKYFANYPYVDDFLNNNITFIDVLGRVFLFKNSKVQERYNAVITHFDMAPKYFNKEVMQAIYTHENVPYEFWRNDELELNAELVFLTGQKKEGFLTLIINYQGEKLYNVNFRLAKGYDGEDAFVLGTIQGTPGGLKLTKVVTKKMFGYRPKNLAIFFIRQLATALGINSLYAVSDEGFYANSHMIRFNRSKSVYFDDFFKELGGEICPEDSRFFRIPLEETRKTYESAKTHKRNLYRKRYALLDEIIEQVNEKVQTMKNQ